MADREAMPGLSCDLFYTNSMCMFVSVYACMCVCMHVFVCMYVTNVCKNISIISISSSLQNEKWHVCICLCAYMCICVGLRGKWLHIYV